MGAGLTTLAEGKKELLHCHYSHSVLHGFPHGSGISLDSSLKQWVAECLLGIFDACIAVKGHDAQV